MKTNKSVNTEPFTMKPIIITLLAVAVAFVAHGAAGPAPLKDKTLVVVSNEPAEVTVLQAGFFTPRRKGMIWDTWMYYHEGNYHMYYLAGADVHWDGHELATSKDGVHWTERGVMVKPRAGVTWMGTGHIWKSADFDKTKKWVMNYSEWFGDKQDIMFNDYLMNLQRVKCNGRIGFLGADNKAAFKNIKVWQSN